MLGGGAEDHAASARTIQLIMYVVGFLVSGCASPCMNSWVTTGLGSLGGTVKQLGIRTHSHYLNTTFVTKLIMYKQIQCCRVCNCNSREITAS